MKRILYILSGLFLLSSCLQELDAPRIDNRGFDGTVVNDGLVTINFDVNFAEEAAGLTKAMANEPTITSLYVAVFDQSHMLETCAEAKSLGPVSEPVEDTYPNVNITRWKYQVTLPESFSTRYLHFLANFDGNLAFGSEDEIIGKLTTSGTQDAYWQRTVAPDGINVDEEGKLISTARDAMNEVALVRNFAKITVTSSADSNFNLKYAYLMNRPTSGTYAPYNSETGSFIEGYQGQTVAELRAAKYDAWMPAGLSLDASRPGELTAGIETGWKKAESGAAVEFTYERETPSKNACFLLVYGTYNNKDYYYKIDLVDKDGKYFPILRNFNYAVNIKSIAAEGRTNVDDAINMQGSGSISTDIDAKELVNISDGVSRLSVSFTEISVVSGVPFEFKYKFVPDFQNAPNTYDNKIVETIENETGKRLSLVKETREGGDVFDFTINNNQTADSDGYYTVIIDPVEPGATIQSQKMTLTGMAKDGTTISREITIVVREKQQLRLFCDEDNIPKETGTEFDVVLQLPGGLTEMMFPLEIKIEAGNLTITPVAGENLPVGSGKSIVLADPANDKETTVNKTAFNFTRTVTWEEYYDNYVNAQGVAHALEEDGTKHFRCHFKSNTAVSASTIWAANKYFYTGWTELGNYDPYKFSNLKFNSGSSFVPGEEASFNFDFATEAGYQSLRSGNKPVTVTLVGFEPIPESEVLTPIGLSATIAGGYEYEYIPTGQTGNTLVITASGNTGPYDIYLDAYHFDQAKGSRTPYVINAGALTFTSDNGGPFYKGTNNTTGKSVYVRSDMFDTDMTSSPNTSVTKGGYNNNYNYKNTDQVECYTNDGTLYFLYDYNGTVYVGTLDVSGNTSGIITSGTVKFEARKDPRQISVPDKTMKAGESYTPTITYDPSGATGGNVTYTSSAPGIVAVSGTTLTAKAAGTATITATVAASGNYEAASCTFKVTVGKGDLTITPKTNPVEIGVTKDGTVTFTYSNGYNGGFVITSADDNICSISNVTFSNGNGSFKVNGKKATDGIKLTIKGNGDANYNAAQAEVTARIVKLEPNVKVGDIRLKTGATKQLSVTRDTDATPTYTSSNTSVATVDANGNVTAVAVGTATITVSTAENNTYKAGSATCTVTVVNKKTVTIAQNALTFTNNTTGNLFGNRYDTSVSSVKVYVNAAKAEYETTSIYTGVKVSSEWKGGYVTGHYEYSFSNNDAMSFEVDPDVSTLYFVVRDGNGRTYLASVGVDDDGKLASNTLTFARAGKTLSKLTVTSENGSTSVKYNQTLKLIATATYSDGTTEIVTSDCTWSSDNTNRATVNAGVVTGTRNNNSAKDVNITATYKFEGDEVSGSIMLSSSK